MMGWYGGGMGYGSWIFMGLLWLALLGVIIWVVARLLSAGGVSGAPQREQDTPEEILDRRFARGEIDVETYQAQRSALAAARSPRHG